MKEFFYAFEITRKIIFVVDYYTLGSNKSPYFSTSVEEFNQPKTSFCRCGQAQNDLLPNHSVARKFWLKWDKFHIKDLTEDEYAELMIDIEELKTKYNWYLNEYNPSGNHYYFERGLSMQPIKKGKTYEYKG